MITLHPYSDEEIDAIVANYERNLEWQATDGRLGLEQQPLENHSIM